MAPGHRAGAAIQCITFDLDDTLWACAPVLERAEAALHDWFARHYPLISRRYSLADMRAQRQALAAERTDIKHDMTALRRAWVARLADELGYAREMVEPAVAYFRHHRNQVRLFAEAGPMLTRLRRRHVVGAITNGNAQLEVIGVDHLFDFIVYAAQAGVAKPEAGIFEAALRRAGVDAGEAIHVGDDPESDIRGAARVGMHTVWYNPAGAAWEGGRPPSAEVASLSELEAVIERM